MEPAFILYAFLGGLAALALRLPPLAGFLLAGFALNYSGYSLTPALESIANLGVTLLLFVIGLKLNVRFLLRPEIWGAATLHMLGATGLLVVLLSLAKWGGLTILDQAGLPVLLLVGFALSFSSTVFAVKVLEDRSETMTLYGRIAIGVLIMQDIFAVVFLSASSGTVPSPWALLLLLLIPLAPWLRRLLDHSGHGEMQMLAGFLLALVLGYHLFELVGIKGDLGALIIGVLLAPHSAAPRLARALFNTKELFLVGFFLSIGLTVMPDWEHLAMAAALLLLLPLKSLLFMVLFSAFRLRARTNVLGTLALSSYSEFGLIVAALAFSSGWLSAEWLVVLSLTVALSFILASVANAFNETIYRRIKPLLWQAASHQLHLDDRPLNLGNAQAVVLGMGKIGRGAYDRLSNHYGMRVLGLDNKPETIRKLKNQGYNIVEGDAVDSDFWNKLLVSQDVELVLMAMPHHAGNLFAIEQLRGRQFSGRIAAIVEYPDEEEPMRRKGADAVFNVYDQAGLSLAESALAAQRLADRPDQDGPDLKGAQS
ncbi:MAG: cation:proton antiporter family protein [Oleiphilaceae bacterium]|nr:cation:proton antiporter family protein [Oleiphilaceae bacterium]